MLWMFRSGSEIKKIAFPVFVNCNHEGVFNPLTRDVVLIRSNNKGTLSKVWLNPLGIFMKWARLFVMWKWCPRHKTPSRPKEITKNSVWLNYFGWHLLNCRSTYCWMTPVSVNVSRLWGRGGEFLECGGGKGNLERDTKKQIVAGNVILSSSWNRNEAELGWEECQRVVTNSVECLVFVSLILPPNETLVRGRKRTEKFFLRAQRRKSFENV